MFDLIWLFACLFLSSWWCVTAAHELSATFDEPFYLASGLDFWRAGSHHKLLEKGVMPLPADVQTLPLYLWERWRAIPLDLEKESDEMLSCARSANLLFWFLLLAYGWRLGSALGGAWGGRLATGLLAFEPNLLAHAGLATTDIAVAACLLAFIYHYWRGRDGAWIRRIGLPGSWLALSILAKASGIVFALLFMAAVDVSLRRNPEGQTAASSAEQALFCKRMRAFWTDLRPFRQDLLQMLALAMILVFLYCGSDWQPEASFVRWAQGLPQGSARTVMIALAENLRIFSNAGEGFVKQIRHNVSGHGVYIMGRSDPRAVWYYFPLLMLIKLPLPIILLPLLLLLMYPSSLSNWICLAAVFSLAASITFRVQIGIRLVSPILCVVLIGVAVAVVLSCKLTVTKFARVFLCIFSACAVMWLVITSLVVWPFGLCYANELAGGTQDGYRWVSDSNYDWGQGLKDLEKWRLEQAVNSMNIWYFGTDPSITRLPLRHLPLHILPISSPQDVRMHARGSLLAVSTTLLYGVANTRAHQVASAYLRTCQPVARTMTFFIYDFSTDRD